MNNPKTEEIVGELRWYADFYEGSTLGIHLHRAADLIEQLQQELIDERYRHDCLQDFCVAQGEELSKIKAQQSCWIPVTERLPGEWKPVLIFVTNPAGWECVTTDIFGNGVWMENCDTEWHNVTHWMPLPKPPKEEK